MPAEPERKELPRITASAEELSAKPVHPSSADHACRLATKHTSARNLQKISGSTANVFAWQVRELKHILDERKISYAGLSEKRELEDRIRDTCQSVTYFSAS